MELSNFCECGEMKDMDGNWYEELPALKRVIWRGAITRMDLHYVTFNDEEYQRKR